MWKSTIKIVGVVLIFLAIVYAVYIFIVLYRPAYRADGPELSGEECYSLGGKVVSPMIRPNGNQGGCLTKDDFLGVVTDYLCNCICCKDRFWNF